MVFLSCDNKAVAVNLSTNEIVIVDDTWERDGTYTEAAQVLAAFTKNYTDKQKAIDDAIHMWEWLAANPGRSKAHYMVEHGVFYIGGCPLCSYSSATDGQCCLVDWGIGKRCVTQGSDFMKWCENQSTENAEKVLRRIKNVR